MQQSQYDPGYKAFGGGSTGSVLHPAVLVAVIVVALLTLVLPRKYVIVPLLLGLLLIPAGQNLYVGGLHFYTYRLLLLVGWIRIIGSRLWSNGKLLPGGFGKMDKLFTVWAVYRAVAGVLDFMQAGVIPIQVALLWDAVGGYFLFRCLVRNEEDVLRALKALAIVAVVAAAGMIHEQTALENWFGRLGGLNHVPEVRNGRIRSQGCFEHALIAGAFGATMFPLFFWLWQRGKSRSEEHTS